MGLSILATPVLSGEFDPLGWRLRGWV